MDKKDNAGQQMASVIELINSVGVVFNDKFIIHQYGKVPIAIDNLEQISFHKKRRYYKNLFAIFLSGVIAFCCLNFITDTYGRFVTGFLALAIVFFSIRFSDYKYELVIVRQSSETEIEIHRNFKNDAKKIVSLINKKLRKVRN